ncbi:MAG: hypothetical protein JWO06_1286, partial [Bacteroidota bacterium]|nr:hypothetical protein [Bacteroidota bacterium]
YHYMNVPISLNFTLGKKKVRGIISVGASLNFLLKKKISYNYSYSDGRSISGTTVDRYDFNKFNVSPFLGIGADFYLTKALVLRLMPIAQMQALKNINTPITEYLWYAGLNVSLQLGFLNAGK